MTGCGPYSAVAACGRQTVLRNRLHPDLRVAASNGSKQQAQAWKLCLGLCATRLVSTLLRMHVCFVSGSANGPLSGVGCYSKALLICWLLVVCFAAGPGDWQPHSLVHGSAG